MKNKIVYRDETMLMVHGDCRQMPELDDNSVDLIVTDPPFNVGFSNYGGQTNDALSTWEYTAFTSAWFHEAMRVLKPGGQLYAIMPRRDMDSWLQVIPKPYEMMPWCRTMANLHREQTFIRAWEPVIWIVKGKRPTTFKRAFRFPADKDWWIGPSAIGETGAIRIKKKHPTPRPDWWYEDIIVRASNPGDLVLDPMVGSGTCAFVSMKLGRRFAGYDIHRPYLTDLSLERSSQKLLWPESLPSGEEQPGTRRQLEMILNYVQGGPLTPYSPIEGEEVNE